jgi:hypothetical protein
MSLNTKYDVDVSFRGTSIYENNFEYIDGVTTYVLRKKDRDGMILFETPKHDATPKYTTTFHNVQALMLTKDHVVRVIYSGDRYQKVKGEAHETKYEPLNTVSKTRALFEVLPCHWNKFVTNLEKWAAKFDFNLVHDDQA